MGRRRILTYEQQETLIQEYELGKKLTPKALCERYGITGNRLQHYVQRKLNHGPQAVREESTLHGPVRGL